jgi:hypothetical protein
MPMFSGEAHAAELAPLQDGPRPGKAAQGTVDGFPIGRDKSLIREAPLFEMIVHRLKIRRLRRAKSVAELSLLGHRDPPIFVALFAADWGAAIRSHSTRDPHLTYIASLQNSSEKELRGGEMTVS